MNLAQTFAPARPLAQHCAELIRQGPRPEERTQLIASWRRDVTREIAQDLGELLSGAKLKASLSEPEAIRGADVFERIGAVAANCLLRCGGDDRTVLLSFDLATAVALTDRSFGGEGEVELDQPESLPRSAALLVEQAARVIAQAITRVSASNATGSGAGGGLGGAKGDVIVRSENAARLKPFEPHAPCVLMTLELTEDNPNALALLPWSARLALRAERFDDLLPGLGGAAQADGTGDTGGPGEKAAKAPGTLGAFAAIPLPLEAVLAEFDMALGRLERLRPGDHIPIPVAREIPLRIGSQIVARGRVGTRDDRMALRLTSGIAKGAAS